MFPWDEIGMLLLAVPIVAVASAVGVAIGLLIVGAARERQRDLEQYRLMRQFRVLSGDTLSGDPLRRVLRQRPNEERN